MIDTERLLVRPWRAADRAAYLAACNTPAVTTHLGGPSTRRQIDAALGGISSSQATKGFSFWAVERKADGAFLGYCGLKQVLHSGEPIDGDIEIGWRLREDAWGQGYAAEAANACLAWAWDHLDVARVVAVTVPANRASWRLMERIGMHPEPELDFEHPHFARGHPLSRHVVYVIDRPHAV